MKSWGSGIPTRNDSQPHLVVDVDGHVKLSETDVNRIADAVVWRLGKLREAESGIHKAHPVYPSDCGENPLATVKHA